MLESVHKAFHAVLQPLKEVSLSCYVRTLIHIITHYHIDFSLVDDL